MNGLDRISPRGGGAVPRIPTTWLIDTSTLFRTAGPSAALAGSGPATKACDRRLRALGAAHRRSSSPRSPTMTVRLSHSGRLSRLMCGDRSRAGMGGLGRDGAPAGKEALGMSKTSTSASGGSSRTVNTLDELDHRYH